MRRVNKICVALVLPTLGYGCGHTHVSQVGLLSVGDLQDKTIPRTIEGPVLVGRDACKIIGDRYYLSQAVRNALQGTSFDTLVDVEVKTKTGLFVWSNKIEVKGKAFDSKTITKAGPGQ